MPAVITIETQPSGAPASQPGDIKDIAWVKDVDKLLQDALGILHEKATDRKAIAVAEHIQMALETLGLQNDSEEVQGMMATKTDKMGEMFGQPEDVKPEE